MSTNLPNFNYWTQRVLPQVYDDSLSYSELLGKVMKYLNDTIDSQNKTNANFEALQTFVDGYFDNLDVTDQINNKLEVMAADGTLDQIINVQIFGDLNEKVDTHTETLASQNIALSKRAEVIDAALTYTVGTNGDFQTINDALVFITRKHPAYKFQGVGAGVKLLLLAGFIMKEQVWINSLNLGYISLESEENEVTIDRQYLTKALGSVARYPAFAFTDGAVSPMIRVLFNMNETGVEEQRNGFNVRLGATILLQSGAGCKNAVRGLHVANGFGYANGGIFTGSKQAGIRVANAGRLWADGAKVDNSLIGFMTDEGYISARDSTAHNCGTASRNVGGRADLRGLKADDCTTVIDSTEQAVIMCRDMIARFAKGTAILLQRNCQFYGDFMNIQDFLGVGVNVNDSQFYARFSNLVGVGDQSLTATSCRDVNILSAKVKQVSIVHGAHVNAKNAIVSAYTGTGFHFNLNGRGNSVIIEGTNGTANMPVNQFNATGFVFN